MMDVAISAALFKWMIEGSNAIITHGRRLLMYGYVYIHDERARLALRRCDNDARRVEEADTV